MPPFYLSTPHIFFFQSHPWTYQTVPPCHYCFHPCHCPVYLPHLPISPSLLSDNCLPPLYVDYIPSPVSIPQILCSICWVLFCSILPQVSLHFTSTHFHLTRQLQPTFPTSYLFIFYYLLIFLVHLYSGIIHYG